VLTITDSTNTTAENQPLKDWLKAKLEYFRDNSTTGRELLTPILGGGTQFEIKISNAGQTIRSGRTVKVNMQEIKYGEKEVAESCLFELTNAANSAEYDKLDTQVKAGQLTPTVYGNSKAEVEAESGWNVKTILTEVGNTWQPSQYGIGQSNDVGQAQSLQAYKPVFAGRQHEVATNAKNPEMNLFTKDMYARKGAIMVASTCSLFEKSGVVLVKKTTGGAQKLVWGQLQEMISFLKSLNATTVPAGCLNFYLAMHKAMVALATEPGYTVTWKTGTAADWALPDPVVRMGVNTDNLKNDIVTAIKDEKAQNSKRVSLFVRC
jgi:hypothetical protein